MNIIDPISNKEYDLFTDAGKKLLKMYVNQLMTGGSRKSTKRGGNPKGRGGKGKTYQNTSRNSFSKTKGGLKSLRTTHKTEQQQQQHKRHVQNKFIENKIKQIDEIIKNPLYNTSFKNANSLVKNIISKNINPIELINIKDKLKLTEEDEKYINMMIGQQIDLSTYTAVGASKQTTMGLKGLMGSQKSWWERMLFAILLLSLFRSVAPAFIDIQSNLPITAGFTEFGGYSFEYFESLDKEREENDAAAAAVAAADVHLSKSKGQKVTAEGYLKSVPKNVIDQIQSISGKIDNLGENKQLYIKGFMLVILGIIMYNMGFYHVATNRYLI